MAESKHKFSDFFYNSITYCGVLLSLFVFTIELFLFAFEFMSGGANVYLGIFTYALLPVFLIIGLILIPIGALWKRGRVLKGKSVVKPRTLFIDPGIPSHRNAIFVFLIGTALFLVMTAVGSYKAFQYTESVEFCGLTCHDVMKPEHTTYGNSPHARVKCVECHIGEGADWFVRAKISGIRQVYHKFKGDYSRPIETPVHNLRPAEETCERCHWPDQFYSSMEMKRTYYSSYDDTKAPWLLRMMINVGRSPTTNEGIHAHMYLDNDIFFAAEDERLQKITWVKSVDKNGAETIFTSPDSKWKGAVPPQDAIQKMDCMDCHNRPTHQYNYPSKLMNKAMTSAAIKSDLPGIKALAMELMSKEYKTEDEAMATIRQAVREHYQKEFGAQFASHEKDVEQAANGIGQLFKNNMFPEMKARWDAYPDNIGHLVSPGCFRCHDGEHASDAGSVITKDCTVCHSIIEQGPPDALQSNTQGIPFVHPFEDDGTWQEMQCTDCHTGN